MDLVEKVVRLQLRRIGYRLIKQEAGSHRAPGVGLYAVEDAVSGIAVNPPLLKRWRCSWTLEQVKDWFWLEHRACAVCDAYEVLSAAARREIDGTIAAQLVGVRDDLDPGVSYAENAAVMLHVLGEDGPDFFEEAEGGAAAGATPSDYFATFNKKGDKLMGWVQAEDVPKVDPEAAAAARRALHARGEAYYGPDASDLSPAARNRVAILGKFLRMGQPAVDALDYFLSSTLEQLRNANTSLRGAPELLLITAVYGQSYEELIQLAIKAVEDGEDFKAWECIILPARMPSVN